MDIPQPILSAWDKTLKCRGSEPAILAADGQVLRSFRDIEAESRKFPWKEQPTAGAVVAIQVGNSPFLPALLLALWRFGCAPLLLDRSLEGQGRNAALRTCGASILIHSPTASATQIPDIEHRIGIKLPAGTDFLKLTSGTSSAPRAIRFTAAQLLADCENVCDTMGITSADLNYGVIPWSHSYGFSNLVTPLLCRGVSVVATEDRLPRAILNGLIVSGATVLPAVPVFFQKLAELPGDRPQALRLTISAGAPLPQTTAKAFRERFGLKIHGFYGSSECGGIAYDSSLAEAPEGCVGEPMRGVDLRHDENTGRIEVHGPAVGTDYFPEPDSSVLGAGRFIPGDLLERTPEGLVIAGRVSDFINIGGRKLNPIEVEHTLRACAGVRDVMVFGVPHPTKGEEPIAFIVGSSTLADLQTHCARSLAQWQVPRDFWIAESLPVNERGKCSRKVLAEMYQQRDVK